MSTFLSVSEAAKSLGCSESLLRKRCADGTLSAIRVGKSYRISREAIEAWVRHTPTEPRGASKPAPHQSDLLSQIDAWLRYLETVKALSPKTIRTHRGHFRCYLKRMGELGEQTLALKGLFERKTILAVFARIPTKSYAVKYNTFNALVSFGSYLVEEGRLHSEAVEAIRSLKPRRQVEARRTCLKPVDIPRLFDVILTQKKPVYENITLAAMIATMVYAGLRVSEVCNVRLQDVELQGRVLTIRHGKGGKDRRVGIGNALASYLDEYQRIRPAGPTYFLQAHAVPWESLMLSKRMRTISKRLGVDITCHGLRRTFATLAANQGRSINSIRIALGHSNLETTQAYLRTSEAEVVESMKDW